MEPNLDQVAKELYGKIQTRFPDIKIADDAAEVLSKKEDIPKARFFEFEYSEHGEPLGTIAISLDADDGIVIKASGDLIDETDPDDTHRGAYQFIRSFRKFARAHMLNYEVNNMGKSNLNKRDYEFHAKSGEEPMMESKMWGTSKVSYQDLGETRLVVKHTQPVNTDLAAGRTMHIESIYIDNKLGERFRYPVRHLNGARAMAQHIGHGGNPYDAIGQHVVSLSEEMAKLRMFKNYVSRTPVVSEAMGTVNSKVIERIEQIKKEVHQLQSAKYYEQFAESFSPSEAKDIPEEIMLDWVDRLTVRSFKEELKDVFPYIYKIVDESELPVAELDPEDILEGAQGQDLGDGFVSATIDAAGGQHQAVLDTQSNTYFFLNKHPNGGSIMRTPAPYLTMKDGQINSTMKVGPATTAAMTKAGLIGQPAQAPAAPATGLNERITPEWLETYKKAKELLANGMTPEQVAKQLGVPGPNNNMTGSFGGMWGAINSAQKDLQQPQRPTLEDKFESFMDSLLEGEKDAMSGDEEAVQGLKDEISKGELKGDLNQSTVVGEYIKDQELLDILDKTSGNDDAWPIVKAWMDQKDPELAKELFADYNPSATGEPPAEEETPPAEEETPPAPEATPAAPPATPAPEAPPAAAPAPVAESAPKYTPDEIVQILSGQKTQAQVDAEKKAKAGQTQTTQPTQQTVPTKEQADNDPPWHDKTPHDVPRGTFKKKVKSGGEMDRARALAQKFAKKGATPQTKVGDKTLHDMMLEFGLTPEECGMAPGGKEMAPPTEPVGDSYEDMKTFASGFYNPQKKNFVPGGTGMKVKIDKQFPGASPADKQRIMHDIERTDPSSSLRETERILHLAGLKGN